MSYKVNKTHFASDERCIGGAMMLQQQFLDMYARIQSAKKAVDDNPPQTSMFRRSYFNKVDREMWNRVEIKPNTAKSRVDTSPPDSFPYLQTLEINKKKRRINKRKQLQRDGSNRSASFSPRCRGNSETNEVPFAGSSHLPSPLRWGNDAEGSNGVFHNSTSSLYTQHQRAFNASAAFQPSPPSPSYSSPNFSDAATGRQPQQRAKPSAMESYLMSCEKRKEELKKELEKISARRSARRGGGAGGGAGGGEIGLLSTEVPSPPQSSPPFRLQSAAAPSPPKEARQLLSEGEGGGGGGSHYRRYRDDTEKEKVERSPLADLQPTASSSSPRAPPSSSAAARVPILTVSQQQRTFSSNADVDGRGAFIMDTVAEEFVSAAPAMATARGDDETQNLTRRKSSAQSSAAVWCGDGDAITDTFVGDSGRRRSSQTTPSLRRHSQSRPRTASHHSYGSDLRSPSPCSSSSGRNSPAQQQLQQQQQRGGGSGHHLKRSTSFVDRQQSAAAYLTSLRRKDSKKDLLKND